VWGSSRAGAAARSVGRCGAGAGVRLSCTSLGFTDKVQKMPMLHVTVRSIAAPGKCEDPNSAWKKKKGIKIMH